MALSRRHFRKGSLSRTHPGRKNFTTKRGDKVYHRRGHYVRSKTRPYHRRRGGYDKGSRSLTRKGRKDFMTHRGDKDYHRRGHDVRKSHTPFSLFM